MLVTGETGALKNTEIADGGTGDEIAAINRGTPARLAALDSVRGLAALIVVIHHCFLTQPAFCDFFFSTWQTPAHTLGQYILFYTPVRIVWSGYEAVTLFYVLSGLVLALPWAERRVPAYRTFVIKRVARIYFPYCAAILGAAVLNLVFRRWAGVPGASEWVTRMNWSHPLTLWTLVDHALMYGHRNSVNGAIHSLIWEMRVSLLFPFLILPIARYRARGAVAVLAGLAAFVVFLQFCVGGGFGAHGALLSSMEYRTTDKLGYEIQWTAYYACFFVMGSLIGFYLQPIRNALTTLSARGRLALLLGGLFVFQGHWSQIHALQETMVAFGSVMVITASLSPGMTERILLRPSLRFLGRISYSLYLVHVPLILAIVSLLQAVPLPVLLAVVPPLSIALGWLFHVTIADPSARFGQRVARMLDHRGVLGSPAPARRNWSQI